MAKYNDLRPTRPDDSLKRLIRRVDNPQTVPHGVKVAQPDERIVFYDSSYVARRWDGDAIADVDKRLADGKAAVDKANASLAVTEQNLAGAADRIKAVEGATTPVAIGDTAAAQINDRRLIVGRDAVVPGTLDVAQLNVTEQMSAQMVSAMSMESKKLVVTEDAIMNRVTVIQDIVTPTLVAQRVSSALVTGSVLQTSPLDNTGVKISNEGYKAYDNAGRLSVNLDGKANRIVGTLSTSAESGAGVNLVQADNLAGMEIYPGKASSITPNNHASIWYDAYSRGSMQGLVIAATRESAVVNSDPQIYLRPGPSGIDFQGRFSGQGSAMKTGTQMGSSVPKDGWWIMKITFLEPMHSQPAISITPITDNNVECAISFTKVTQYGFEAGVVNKSNRDSGNATLRWIAMAI